MVKQNYSKIIFSIILIVLLIEIFQNPVASCQTHESIPFKIQLALAHPPLFDNGNHYIIPNWGYFNNYLELYEFRKYGIYPVIYPMPNGPENAWLLSCGFNSSPSYPFLIIFKKPHLRGDDTELLMYISHMLHSAYHSRYFEFGP